MEEDHLKYAAEQIRAKVPSYINKEDEHWYRFESPRNYPAPFAQDFTEALAWLRMIQRFTAQERYLEVGIRGKGDYLQLCTELLKKRRLKGLKVTSPAYLSRKVAIFPADPALQRLALLHQNIGNHNALKVGKNKLMDRDSGEILPFDIHEALIYYIYMNPGSPVKLSKTDGYRYYSEGCRDFGVDPVAERTFDHRVSRWTNRMVADKARHGEGYFKKQVLTYVPGDKVKYAHSLFAADGSASILYKYYDKSGKCRRMNLYVITITDVASRFMAGWAPSQEGTHEETPQMVRSAVKMAVQSGGDQTMFEIVSDNHGAYTGAQGKQFLEGVFNRVRTIQPGNSQANDAETHFRLFKKTLRQFDNFLRTSFNCGIEGQANPDHVMDNEDLPTYQEVIAQFSTIVSEWNNTPMPGGYTPAELFEQKHPDCKPIDPRVYRQLFGESTRMDISGMRGFVNITRSLGKQRTITRYEIPDYETSGLEKISRMTGHGVQIPVQICYDKKQADLYNLAGEYILTCELAGLSGKAEIEKTSDHRLAESHHMERKARALRNADVFEAQVKDVKGLLDIGSAVDPRTLDTDEISASMLDPYELRITDTSLKHRAKERVNEEFEYALNGVTVRNDFDDDENEDDALRVHLKDPRQDAIDQM